MLAGYIGCKGDKTGQAVKETVNIMTDLQTNIPPKALKQKRLDALNSFVFNVDTPTQLVKTYATYHLRQEPLDTLERIQDAYLTADREELETLAEKFVDPKKLKIIVVGDKTTLINRKDGKGITLEEDLKALARTLELPYEEIELR